MPKIKKDSIAIEDLRKKIREKIITDYKTVYAFAKSGIPEKNNILGSNIPIYLSPKGSVSFKTLQALCNLLKIGELKRVVKVKKTVEYFL